MTKNYQTPRWITKMKSQLNDLKSVSDNLIISGNKDIKRGMEKMKKGKKLKSEIVYLDKVVSSSNEAEFWDDDFAKVETFNLVKTFDGLFDRLYFHK